MNPGCNLCACDFREKSLFYNMLILEREPRLMIFPDMFIYNTLNYLGFWILDLGFWCLHFGALILDSGSWNFGVWILEF